MNKTGIEYLDYTWNPISMRCTPVSEGCANCWHLRMADRMKSNPKISKEIRECYAGTREPLLIQERLNAPMKVKKSSRIGVQFMGDLFHPDITREIKEPIYHIIEQCQQHTFIVLTKRPGNIGSYWMNKIDNAWLGVTAENQEQADKRIPILLQIPTAIRFVSFEPLLGPIESDFNAVPFFAFENEEGTITPGIDWVICSGESGSNARPMHPDWARSLKDQCKAAGVPFFFKQWGEWQVASAENGHFDHDMQRNKAYWLDIDGRMQKPSWHGLSENVIAMVRVGKKPAGRILDGKTWNEYPNS